MVPEPETVLAHLERLFESAAPHGLHDAQVEIAYGKNGPDKAQLFPVSDLDAAAAFAGRVNAVGNQVYVGAALRKSDYHGHPSKTGSGTTMRALREHVLGACVLWADADNAAQVQAAITAYKGADCPPDFVVITGTVPEQRAHFWWLLDEPVTDLARLETALAGIAARLGTDRVIDAPRVMRLAGTVNWASKPGRVDELVTMRWRNGEDSVTSFARAWAVYAQISPPPAAASGTAGYKVFTLTGRFDLLAAAQRAAQPGRWHETVLQVVAHLAGLGRSDAEILLVGRSLTQSGYTHEQTDADVRVMLKGARAKGWVEDATVVQAVAALDKPEVKRPANLPSFDPDLIPAPFRDYVLERCDLMQVPLEYVAVPIMVAAGNTIAGRLAVRPRKADWLVTTNLWGAIIGPPGTMKTAAMMVGLKPLRRVEAQAWRAFQQDITAWEQAADPKPVKPIHRRFTVSDATEAKLGEIIAENTNGVLLVRDELRGWFAQMLNPARASERQFFLEAWNGLGSYRIDRVVRGSLYIPRLCLGILGGLQPTVFEREFLDKLHAEGDGLLQRFQLLVWPEVAADWRNVDHWPDQAFMDKAHAVFARLADMAPDTIGTQHQGDACPWVRLSAGAQEAYDDFLSRLEPALRSGKRWTAALTEHYSKFRSLVPALAMILDVVERPVRIGAFDVGLSSMEKALRWAEYLRRTAERIYAMGEIREDKDLERLMDLARAGRFKVQRADGSFTARDAYVVMGRKQDDVQPLLDQAVERGMLSVEERKGRGRGGRFLFYRTL